MIPRLGRIIHTRDGGDGTPWAAALIVDTAPMSMARPGFWARTFEIAPGNDRASLYLLDGEGISWRWPPRDPE